MFVPVTVLKSRVSRCHDYIESGWIMLGKKIIVIFMGSIILGPIILGPKVLGLVVVG